MTVERIHHVAYRCINAKETADFYRRTLDMELMLVFAEERVPSTNAPDPYVHIFLDAGSGNILAFFELPTAPAMGRDPNTPEWVQHIAFEVADGEVMAELHARLLAEGVDVVGPTDHGIFQSIYFFDPSGHRLEVTHWTRTDEQMAELTRLAPLMLNEWDATGKIPEHTRTLHHRAPD